jgi:predicted ribosomally synthesized peptide with SipW-like signal peptide
MRKSVTRNALLLSAASLAFSTILFTGSTYAWFTQSVISGPTEIQSGSMKVALEIFNGDTWVDISNADSIFKLTNDDGSEKYWEPGTEKTVYFRVYNAGALALKYELDLAANTADYTNTKGETVSLKQFITFSTASTDFAQFASRSSDDEIPESSTETEIDWKEGETEGSYTGSAVLAKGSLAAEENSYNYFAITAKMQDDCGDDANWNAEGENPSISFQLFLSAAQDISEGDSYGNSYDSAAYLDRVNYLKAIGYSEFSSGELASAANAGPVVLTGDVVKGNNQYIYGDYVVDLNGNTITLETSYRIYSPAKVSLSNGTYLMNNVSGDHDGTAYIYGQKNNETEIVFENMNFISTRNSDENQAADILEVFEYIPADGSKVEIKFINCTFDQTYFAVASQQNSGSNELSVSFENCTFNLTGTVDSTNAAVSFGNYSTGTVSFSGCTFNMNMDTTSYLFATSCQSNLEYTFTGNNVLNDTNGNVQLYTLTKTSKKTTTTVNGISIEDAILQTDENGVISIAYN